jgi:hypothetical protein
MNKESVQYLFVTKWLNLCVKDVNVLFIVIVIIKDCIGGQDIKFNVCLQVINKN